MLGAPTSGLTVANALIPINLVQGLPDEYSTGTVNLYTGYDGTGSSTQGSPPPNGFIAPANESTTLARGKGFIWYLFTAGVPASGSGGNESFRRGLPSTFSASSTPVNGDITAIFSDRVSVGDGFYLLANPFPVHFDVSNVSVNSGTLSTLFQVYNPGTNSYTDITSSVTDGVSDVTTDNVAPWQGMFAQATGGAATKTFTYSWGGAVSSGSTTFIGKNTASSQVRLGFRLEGLTQAGVSTEDEMARVLFAEDAMADWDQHDASKLYPLSSPYAVVAPVGTSFREGEQEVKAQESLPLVLADVQRVPLAFTASTAGTYTLTWPTMDGLPSSWGLTLTDKTTGTVTDLRQASQYRFTSDAASEQQRFLLTINPGTVTSADEPNATATGLVLRPFANPVRGAATLTLDVPAPGDVSVRVYDLLGRAVATLHDGALAAGVRTLALDASSLPTGVYVVRAEASGASATRTFVVVR